jgi:hypothetical protein
MDPGQLEHYKSLFQKIRNPPTGPNKYQRIPPI